MSKLFKMFVSIVLVMSMLSLYGCGGMMNTPMTTEPQFKHIDLEPNCGMVLAELDRLDAKKVAIEKSSSRKVGGNIFSVVFGVILFFPIFFLDLSTDEDTAMASVNSRIDYLELSAIELNCPEREVVEEVIEEEVIEEEVTNNGRAPGSRHESGY